MKNKKENYTAKFTFNHSCAKLGIAHWYPGLSVCEKHFKGNRCAYKNCSNCKMEGNTMRDQFCHIHASKFDRGKLYKCQNPNCDNFSLAEACVLHAGEIKSITEDLKRIKSGDKTIQCAYGSYKKETYYREGKLDEKYCSCSWRKSKTSYWKQNFAGI